MTCLATPVQSSTGANPRPSKLFTTPQHGMKHCQTAAAVLLRRARRKQSTPKQVWNIVHVSAVLSAKGRCCALPRCVEVFLLRHAVLRPKRKPSVCGVSVFALLEAARLHVHVHVIDGDFLGLFAKLWQCGLPRCITFLLFRLLLAMRHTSVFGVCFHTSGRRAPIFVRLCRLCRIIALAPAAWGSSWGSNPHR